MAMKEDGRWSDQEIDTLLRMHAQNTNRQEIARVIGRSPNAVTNMLGRMRQAGVIEGLEKADRSKMDTMPIPYPFTGWELQMSSGSRRWFKGMLRQSKIA